MRLLSVDLLHKVCKASGALVKPHLPMLVNTLLEGLTVLEPAAFNYLTLHAEKYSYLSMLSTSTSSIWDV